MSPPPAAPAAAPAADAPKKEKKSYGSKLVEFGLALLFTVIFIYFLNAMLGIIFPGVAESFRITATGFQSTAIELTRLNVSLGAFMTAVISILVRVLLILLFFMVGMKLARAIMEWAKS